MPNGAQGSALSVFANRVSGFLLQTIPINIFNTLHYGYTRIIAAACLTLVFVALAVPHGAVHGSTPPSTEET